MNQLRIYISLPIAGQETTVAKRCMEAEERLKKVFAEADTGDYKLMVVFPKDVDKIGTSLQDTTKPLGYWIGEDIKLLMECDATYVCDGYIDSNGCQLEIQCADIYKKKLLSECYSDFTNAHKLGLLVKEMSRSER